MKRFYSQEMVANSRPVRNGRLALCESVHSCRFCLCEMKGKKKQTSKVKSCRTVSTENVIGGEIIKHALQMNYSNPQASLPTELDEESACIIMCACVVTKNYCFCMHLNLFILLKEWKNKQKQQHTKMSPLIYASQHKQTLQHCDF